MPSEAITAVSYASVTLPSCEITLSKYEYYWSIKSLEIYETALSLHKIPPRLPKTLLAMKNYVRYMKPQFVRVFLKAES